MENETKEYAGFWIRFIAYIIDSIVIGFLEFLIVLPILGLLGIQVFDLSTIRDLENADPELMIPVIASAITGLSLTVLLITWFYYALLQSGSRQATIGKMALNLKVTDANGERLTFARASLRYFSKILSSFGC